MVFSHANAVKCVDIANEIMNRKYTMKEIANEMQKICDTIIPAHQIVDPNDSEAFVDIAEAHAMPTEYGVEISVATKNLRYDMYEAKLLANLTAIKALTLV